MKKNLLLLLVIVSTAVTSHAQFSNVGALVNDFTKNVVTSVGYLFLTLAVVAFFWGVVKFIWASQKGDSKEVENGKTFIVWGLVGLFVMFSVYGIISFGQGLIPGLNKKNIDTPVFNTGGGTSGSGKKDNGARCSSSGECSSGKCGAYSGVCESASVIDP